MLSQLKLGVRPQHGLIMAKGALPVAIIAAVIGFQGTLRDAECATVRCYCFGTPAGGAALRRHVARGQENAAAVFLGTVDTIRTTGEGPVVARLQVSRWWKGGVGDSIDVVIRESVWSWSMCDLLLKAGDVYVLFAYARPDGRLEVSKCGPGGPRSRADSVLAVLGPGRAPGG